MAPTHEQITLNVIAISEHSERRPWMIQHEYTLVTFLNGSIVGGVDRSPNFHKRGKDKLEKLCIYSIQAELKLTHNIILKTISSSCGMPFPRCYSTFIE